MDATARLSVKLGDICAKLGENNETIKWWDRALRSFGVDGTRSHPANEAPFSRLTNAPTYAQQRIIASALVSLSGYYASRSINDRSWSHCSPSTSLILRWDMVNRCSPPPIVLI